MTALTSPVGENARPDEPRIIIENLVKGFVTKRDGFTTVIDGLNLEIDGNEFVSIVGPSGCGKSTILNMLSGLDTDFSGTARITHSEFHSNDAPAFSIVFQEPRLLPWMTVKENVTYALRATNVRKAQWDERVIPVLARVGLADFHDHYPHQISGGMQQRTAIARALVLEAPVMLMDEPFSGLDEFTARSLRQLLLELRAHETHKAFVFVTHNVFEAAVLSDRVVVLSNRPSHIHKIIDVDVEMPRNYDDPRLFEISRGLTQEILGFMSVKDGGLKVDEASSRVAGAH
jgi:NitT/TauT family transport system ATP-binding protein